MKETLIVLALLPVLALTACTANTSGSRGDTSVFDSNGPVKIVHQQRGVTVPQNNSSSSNEVPAAYWTSAKRSTVDLLTYGSSSCPVIPATIKVESDTRVQLTMKKYSGACTADFAPHTTRFYMPSKVSRATDVTLTLVQGDTSTVFTLHPSPTVADHPKYTPPAS